MEGHSDSGNLLAVAVTFLSADVSWTGVVGRDGKCGLFLSVETALFGANWVVALTVLVTFGDVHRLETDGVGDLYLELTSLV